MNGDGDNIGDFGIIPRSITYIFDLIKERNNSEKYSVKVSYYRHNTAFDEIEDLLNDDPNQIVKIKESKELGTYIQNLSTVPTKNSNEMYEYFIKGKNKFTREFTSFFTVTIDSIKTTKSDDSSIKNSTRTGRLYFIDMKAWDCENTYKCCNQHSTEAKYISKSLTPLAMVVAALADNSSHVPYRSGKDTRLLKDVLGGNCKTVWISNININSTYYDKTISTLLLSSRVKCIENKPVINTHPIDNSP
ncbi:DgyrCDS3882 [Dimorphilus gyrociliatus]|uniref:DgyrCDS3882 n=1 Tax=Dimorphilus gyrociliatus TaxID=2664684 RepID=A0A7I8VEP8_9ANNE|nr:DgyrCDS3882 [Dimorphilus gyrociliatus]